MAVHDITDIRRFQASTNDPELYHSAFETTTSSIIEHYLLGNLEAELPLRPTVHDLAVRLREIDRIVSSHQVGEMILDLEALPRVTTTHIYRPGDIDYPPTLTPLLDFYYRTRTWTEEPVSAAEARTLPLESFPFTSELAAERTLIGDIRDQLPQAVTRPGPNSAQSMVDRWLTNKVIRKAAATWVRGHLVARRELATVFLPATTMSYVEGADGLPGSELVMTTRTLDGIVKRYRSPAAVLVPPVS